MFERSKAGPLFKDDIFLSRRLLGAAVPYAPRFELGLVRCSPQLDAVSRTAAYAGQVIFDGESELWSADETVSAVATREIANRRQARDRPATAFLVGALAVVVPYRQTLRLFAALPFFCC